MVSSKRRVASMISGPMPSPRMTVICCVTLPSLFGCFSGSLGPARYRLASCLRPELPGSPPAAAKLQAQHAIKGTLLIKCIKGVKAADVRVANEDLRHRPAPAALDHLGAQVGVIDQNLSEIDIFGTQQIARRNAERAA